MGKLLRFVSTLWQKPDLREVGIIAAQHVMTSTFKLFEELRSSGLDPKKTFIIGKSYSTSKKVFSEFLDAGFQIHPYSLAYNSHLSFDLQYEAYLEEFIDGALLALSQTRIKKLIVVDDGGYLIDKIYKRDSVYQIVCVEQTSAGLNYLKERPALPTVINVAKSRAKLSLETPFIVESALKRLFKKVSQEKLIGQKVLITGKGSIGAYVGKLLENYCSVFYYDTNIKQKQNLNELVEEVDFVIGCSGACAIKYELYANRKKPLFLVSFSSSDREFEGHKIRETFPINRTPHKNYSFRNVFLINGGFPINFWGSKNNMRMEKIELTMSLLLGAIYQGLLIEKNDTGGILNLDEEFERLVIKEFQKRLARLKLDLNIFKGEYVGSPY